MNRRITPFQAILLVVFGAATVISVLLFAGTTATGGNSQTPTLIWGTANAQAFNTVIHTLSEKDDRFKTVTYEQINAPEFNSRLVEALASGKGPDLFLLPQDEIVRYQNKVVAIPYTSIPQRQFTDTFAEIAELYLTPEGSVGVPLVIDPLVLYWNRDMLSSAGFAAPPKYWDEVFPMAEKMTVRDQTGEITKSTIAFGEYENVLNAKDIVSALIMQAGGSVVTRTEQGMLTSGLLGTVDSDQSTQNALRFFTEFANPAKNVYSWNRALPNSRTAFASGDLALYVGYGSEYAAISAQNPNLNFAVAVLPQVRNGARSLTFGRVYAFAIPIAAPDPSTAASVAYALAADSASKDLASALGVVSARRDVLAEKTDGVESVLRDSAIIARAWTDPEPSRTAAVFKEMIESVTVGTARLGDAVGRADRALLDIVDYQ